jgi:hypothetical protein
MIGLSTNKIARANLGRYNSHYPCGERSFLVGIEANTKNYSGRPLHCVTSVARVVSTILFSHFLRLPSIVGTPSIVPLPGICDSVLPQAILVNLQAVLGSFAART